MFDRWYAGILREKLTRPYVHLVFGARQTGKSTLLRSLLPPESLVVNLADPKERTRHLADPGAFVDAGRGLPADQRDQFVFVDEAQAVPTVFNRREPPTSPHRDSPTESRRYGTTRTLISDL